MEFFVEVCHPYGVSHEVVEYPAEECSCGFAAGEDEGPAGFLEFEVGDFAFVF